jgi:hypothetical protein
VVADVGIGAELQKMDGTESIGFWKAGFRDTHGKQEVVLFGQIQVATDFDRSLSRPIRTGFLPSDCGLGWVFWNAVFGNPLQNGALKDSSG